MSSSRLRQIVRTIVPKSIRRAVARARGRGPDAADGARSEMSSPSPSASPRSVAARTDDRYQLFFSLEGRYQRLVDNLGFIRGAAGKGYVAPPQQVPEALRDAFTMGGTVPIIDWYFNSKPDPKSIGSVVMYRSSLIDEIRKGLPLGKYKSYGETNDYLRDALAAYPIKDKIVLICGSAYPQYEGFCLNAGGFPVTIEYNVRFSDLDTLTFFSPAQFEALGAQGDAAISISSFEHDGLGRYGDPVDPDGDLKAMRRLRHQIVPGGLAFVSVPLGRDAVVWNAHRIYGPRRLPAFLEGWEVLACFGDEKQLIGIADGEIRIDPAAWERHFEPRRTGTEWVFVLRAR